jgi:triosephosphate isomerase
VSKLRKKIIAGNWKMNKGIAEAEDLASGIKMELTECREVDVVLCPPFTALRAVGEVIEATQIKLGAQNMHWETEGAYTGEISASMLRDIYCHYVILGHSERRGGFGETNAIVNRKVKAALAGNLIPIACVGETLKERETGKTQEVIREQVEKSLAGLEGNLSKVVVAYEPVWAIGTGLTATPEQAQDVHAFIRDILKQMADEEVSKAVRIQYGGSMKPGNAADLLKQPDIDGGLIGGAALDARSFVEIVRAAM